jgi:hypothetical protein
MPFRFEQVHDQGPGGGSAVDRTGGLAGKSAGHSGPSPLSGSSPSGRASCRPLLEKIGVDRGHLERIIEAELSHFPKVSGGAQPQPDQELMKIFEAAAAEADIDEGRVRLDRPSAPAAGEDARRRRRTFCKLAAVDEGSCWPGSRRCGAAPA